MKLKVKLFEKSGSYIRYEIYDGKIKVNQGWHKTWCTDTTGTIAKNILDMYSKIK